MDPKNVTKADLNFFIKELKLGPKTNLLDISDKLISTINLYRNLLANDKNNQTGIFDHVHAISCLVQHIINGVQLSVAYYRWRLGGPEPEVSVEWLELPVMEESDEEKEAKIREKDSGSGSGIVIPPSGSDSNLITGPRKSVKNDSKQNKDSRNRIYTSTLRKKMKSLGIQDGSSTPKLLFY